jgi:uncharacterized protein YndB with AHSA1/START domain
MKISVNVLVPAPIEKVWSAYTTPKDIMRWNAASDDWHTTASRVDLRPGGEFSSRMEAKDGSFGFDFEGVYTQIIENEFIEYLFGDRLATVKFDAEDTEVRVTVEFDTEEDNSVEDQRTGWQSILDDFARHVQTK